MLKLDIENKFITRSKGGYIPFKNLGSKFKASFFPHTALLWNYLPKTAQCKDLFDFKQFTNKDIKPPKFKHFARGNKFSNPLLTKVRVSRSDLNQHKFTIGLVDSPQCLCYFREESPSNFFLDCFLYLLERQTLFDLIEHYIPKIKSEISAMRKDPRPYFKL